ncbi:MAG: hypothetical protein ACHQ7M_06855 [Chloroflexota bacterium]
MALNAVVLPAAGINGFAQLTGKSFEFLGPSANDTSPAASEDREHSLGASKFFSLWLRPFGVHRSNVNDVWLALGSFAVVWTITTAVLFLFPKRIRYASTLLRAEPGGNHLLNVVLGLLAYFVAYALLRLSWLTIVGVPFIPFLVGGVWLLTMMGIVAVSFTLGRTLLRRVDVALSPLAETLLGLWLLFVTSMLPFLGWIAGGLAASLGLGVLLQTRLGTRQRWSLEVLDEPLTAPEFLPDDPKILPLRRAR